MPKYLNMHELNDEDDLNTPIVNADENNLTRESIADCLRIPVNTMGLVNTFSEFRRIQSKCGEGIEIFLMAKMLVTRGLDIDKK